MDLRKKHRRHLMLLLSIVVGSIILFSLVPIDQFPLFQLMGCQGTSTLLGLAFVVFAFLMFWVVEHLLELPKIIWDIPLGVRQRSNPECQECKKLSEEIKKETDELLDKLPRWKKWAAFSLVVGVAAACGIIGLVTGPGAIAAAIACAAAVIGLIVFLLELADEAQEIVDEKNKLDEKKKKAEEHEREKHSND